MKCKKGIISIHVSRLVIKPEPDILSKAHFKVLLIRALNWILNTVCSLLFSISKFYIFVRFIVFSIEVAVTRPL